MAVPVPPDCPNIHEARQALEQAEGTLRSAAHDFCGHKADAMRAVHNAIEQLRMAENCAKCR
jgi:F0F1-type ATP synthase epsilon subunit